MLDCPLRRIIQNIPSRLNCLLRHMFDACFEIILALGASVWASSRTTRCARGLATRNFLLGCRWSKCLGAFSCIGSSYGISDVSLRKPGGVEVALAGIALVVFFLLLRPVMLLRLAYQVVLISAIIAMRNNYLPCCENIEQVEEKVLFFC